jgi:hypothetical protein
LRARSIRLFREGGGRPVSAERLAIPTENEPTTLRKKLEPTLTRLGLLPVTTHGRAATEGAMEVLSRSDREVENGFPVACVDCVGEGGDRAGGRSDFEPIGQAPAG